MCIFSLLNTPSEDNCSINGNKTLPLGKKKSWDWSDGISAVKLVASKKATSLLNWTNPVVSFSSCI